MSPPEASRPTSSKPAVELWLELTLFRSRWLMAPFYVGLVFALAGLLVVFGAEVWRELAHVTTMTPESGVLMALSLIDLSLAGNLLLIVILSGYENFVSRIDAGDPLERPHWMGKVDFSGMKMKLIASIVAISAIALLKAFMRLAEGEHVDDRQLAWLVGIHLTFVVSGVLLALMDLLVSRSARH
jgi:uncharacterized protein (TIGR00645 family)